MTDSSSKPGGERAPLRSELPPATLLVPSEPVPASATEELHSGRRLRPRLDQLTEDDLDALHAQLEASEAATAMFKARAEQAEAERDDARADRDTVDRLRKAALDGRNAAVQRADRAEAAIARVRAELANPLLRTRDLERQGERWLAARIRAALDGTT